MESAKTMKRVYVSVEAPEAGCEDRRELESIAYRLRNGKIYTVCPYCGHAQTGLFRRYDRLWFCTNYMCKHTFEVW